MTDASSDAERKTADFLHVATAAGAIGIWGPMSMPQSSQLLLYLRERLIGLDLDDALHEVAAAACERHATGLVAMACTACDLAIWDALGKEAGTPIYGLLGDPVRDRVRCYASLLGSDLADDETVQTMRSLSPNYWGFKFAARPGPSAGVAGMRCIIDALARLRSAGCGRLMIDALCGWNAEHTLAFLAESEWLGLAWIEEPLPAGDLINYRRITSAAATPIAAGEHAYSLCDARNLIDCGVRILQPDAGWCGGLRVFDAIVQAAAKAELSVFPHGGGLLPALHLSLHYTDQVLPAIEHHLTVEPRRQHFWREKFAPVDGEIAAPARPGLGIELDDDVITEARDFRRLEWAAV